MMSGITMDDTNAPTSSKRIRRGGRKGNITMMAVILATLSSNTSSFLVTSPSAIQANRHHQMTCMTPSKLHATINPNENESSLSEEEGEDEEFLSLFQPSAKCNADQMNPTSLAYIGDVVFELFIRNYFVWPNRSMARLQHTVVAIVRAEYQSKLLHKMTTSFSLTPKELTILKRGRNAGGGSSTRKRGPKRLHSKKSDGGSSDASIYQDSTAFEALIGYTYITDKKRCMDMFCWIKTQLEEEENDGNNQ
uniref:RNase III domain-containing protein n=2 Tax=Ditylum brightwellii TaxID=49249 RepID=A0A6U3SDX9_9STRA|mmetsp:Transcript_32200/g.48020  ORF Transcript_32200/g.48020 Transcript_32200/m.48020 type:complete len:250 (+) Transcript_32200:258-1007(+)